MKYLDGTTIKKKDRVVIAQDRPPGIGQEEVFVVSVLGGENTGKVVGVTAAAPSPFLHDLDGATEPNTGWWTRPEHVAKVTE